MDTPQKNEPSQVLCTTCPVHLLDKFTPTTVVALPVLCTRNTQALHLLLVTLATTFLVLLSIIVHNMNSLSNREIKSFLRSDFNFPHVHRLSPHRKITITTATLGPTSTTRPALGPITTSRSTKSVRDVDTGRPCSSTTGFVLLVLVQGHITPIAKVKTKSSTTPNAYAVVSLP